VYLTDEELDKKYPTIKDVVGIPLTVGSRVTYPVRQGSRMWVNAGEVVELDRNKNLVKVFNGKRRYWVKAERCTSTVLCAVEVLNHA
jgi:hypothetical protein